MLILFHIDGTLLLSDGAGAKSMVQAGRTLWGDAFSFEGVEIAGRLDPCIWADAMAASGLDATDAAHEVFRRTYADILARRLVERPTTRALPGVHLMIERLAGEDVTQGLLTGNYPETGRLKIEAAGIDPDGFAVAAWGSDGASRRDLPPVAIERFQRQVDRPVDPAEVVIIGDTPHDVDCAHANGCRVLGVGTGPSYTLAELEQHRPDLAVADLSDTETLVRWILDPAASSV